MESLLVLALVCLSTYVTIYKLFSQNNKVSKEVLDDQRELIRELLNRVQAKDLHAFATLQANTTNQTETNYVEYPKNDVGEAAQLKAMYQDYAYAEGLGETLFDNNDMEFIDTMVELGLDIKDDA